MKSEDQNFNELCKLEYLSSVPVETKRCILSHFFLRYVVVLRGYFIVRIKIPIFRDIRECEYLVSDVCES